jgi:hypothetical protein
MEQYQQLELPLEWKAKGKRGRQSGRPLTEKELAQRKAARAAWGRKYHGTMEHKAWCSLGYFDAGAKYGWEYINKKLFGQHLTHSQAIAAQRMRVKDNPPTAERKTAKSIA